MRFLLTVFAVLSLLADAVAAEPTVLTVTGEVVQKEVGRFGININDGEIKKERIRGGGFEGVIYRTLWSAERCDGKTFRSTMKVWDTWKNAVTGAGFRIITGPARGLRGRVVAVGESPNPEAGKPPLSIFALAEPCPEIASGFMFILDKDESDKGYIGQHGDNWWVLLGDGGTVSSAAGDTPPGADGKTVAVLDAPGKASAELLTNIGGPSDGEWMLRFWAKGSGRLVIGQGDWNGHRTRPAAPLAVELTAEWKRYELPFTVANCPLPNLLLGFTVSGGTAKLDDVSCIRGGDTNPTAFTDAAVKVLKWLRPGSMRDVHMGGSSMENVFRPDRSRLAYAPNRAETPPQQGGAWLSHPASSGRADTDSYSLPELLRLSQEIGSEPWYCIPGLVHPEEMAKLVEFLAAPADTPMGALRRKLGQDRPWTEVLPRITIEIGNEAWNYSGPYNLRGYMGPDYWSDLIAAAKAAQHYTPRIRFLISGQAGWVGRNSEIAGFHRNADGFAVAPYLIHGMDKSLEDRGAEAVWSNVFATPWYQGHMGCMYQNYQSITKKFGYELLVYEVNHHITGGDASLKVRNDIVAGIGGGINIANWMMMMLQEQGIRTQNFFHAWQHHYSIPQGEVQLWGGVLSMEPGKERYRPSLLALQLLNRVLAGDLVRIARSGADPRWTCGDMFDDRAKQVAGKWVGNDPFEIPCIQAYALREGRNHAAVIFNFHRTDRLPVRLVPGGPVKAGSALRWTLAADRIGANNEKDEQVKVAEDSPALDENGLGIDMAPFSMAVVRWQDR